MVSAKANDCHTTASFYNFNGKKLQRQFKDYLSNFKQWKEKSHAKDWLLFPQNIGSKFSIDEVALSKGELYTVVTNKKAKGKAGSNNDITRTAEIKERTLLYVGLKHYFIIRFPKKLELYVNLLWTF